MSWDEKFEYELSHFITNKLKLLVQSIEKETKMSLSAIVRILGSLCILIDMRSAVKEEREDEIFEWWESQVKKMYERAKTKLKEKE